MRRIARGRTTLTMVGLVLVATALVACERELPEITATGMTSAEAEGQASPLPEPMSVLPTPGMTVVSALTPQREKEEPVTDTPTATAAPAAGMEGLIALAREDLAGKLSISRDEIQVLEAKAVVWPDGALGCPQPGMAYTQVLQEGTLILLEAGGRVYHYHSGGGRAPFLCEGSSADGALPGSESPSAATPRAAHPTLAALTAVPLQAGEVFTVSKPVSPAMPAATTPGMDGLVLQATEDLAERLSIDPERIELLEAKAVVWPDGSLGCPDPDMIYTQVQREGTLIRLRAGKRVYEYHSGGGRTPFLCEQPAKDGRGP